MFCCSDTALCDVTEADFKAMECGIVDIKLWKGTFSPTVKSKNWSNWLIQREIVREAAVFDTMTFYYATLFWPLKLTLGKKIHERQTTFFFIVFASSTRRDLEEVKEELREERTRRQALQVSGAWTMTIQPLAAPPLRNWSFFFLSFFKLAHPGGSAEFEVETLSMTLDAWHRRVHRNSRPKCLKTYWNHWGCKEVRSDVAPSESFNGLETLDRLDFTGVLYCFTSFYISVCRSFFWFQKWFWIYAVFIEFQNIMCFLKKYSV